jgi:hypothetical protein
LGEALLERRNTRSLSSGAHSRDPLAIAPYKLQATADGPDDCLTGKSVNCCLPPFAKIFLFRLTPNHFYIVSRLVPLEGRIAIVTDAGRDAVDAAASGV